jgi:iron complex outermembrane receptor protein
LDGRIDVLAGPFSFSVLGNPGIVSEEMVAYELGYRWNSGDHLSVETAFFYNEYDNLVESHALIPIPSSDRTYFNTNGGYAYGGELSINWYPSDNWHLKANYSYAKVHIENDAGETDEYLSGNVPQHQVGVHSMLTLSEFWELDIWGQYVDEISVATSTFPVSVDGYATLNLRLGWMPKPDLEFSLVGKNILDNRRLEYYGEIYTPATEVARSIFAQLVWKWR